MTTREKLEQMLFEKGMFLQQAHKVMDITIPIVDELSDDFKVEWDGDFEQYDDNMYGFLFEIAKKEALAWIDANIPTVWFRNNFIN